MVNLKVPSYISSAFEEDCKRLGVPRDFFTEVISHEPMNEFGDRGGFCKPIIVNGEKHVVAGIRDEGNNWKTLGNLRHQMKHAQQFFTGSYSKSSFIRDEMEAYSYECVRGIEDAFGFVYRKFRML